MVELTKLEVWNARTSCSQTKNEEDEGETGVEMLETRESPDGGSPPILRELNELRGHPKGISETATGRGRLFTKSESHWLNKYPLREILTLIDTILGEQCKDTAALEERLNLIAVELEKLRKDRSAHIYKDLCISEEKEAMTRDVDSLKLKVEKLRGQCKRSASEQLNQMRMECNELRRDREALIYEATRISEEKETLMEDRDALNLEVEKLREQCKKVAALENQLNQMNVECNELRKDREALIYEVISISEEKENIKLEKDVLNLEIENIRIEFGRKF